MARSNWAENTRRDLEALDPSETVILVPTGAVEQHGPHLPVGTDAFISDAIVRASAARLEDTVALPVLSFGYSPHHGGVPGTVTLSTETFLGLITDVLESLVDDGFERIAVVNGHGGNRSLLKTAVSDFRAESDVSVAVLSYWDLISDEITNERNSEMGGISHGGEMETSVLLHLHEELVDDDRPDFIRDDHSGLGRTDLFGTGVLYYPQHFDEMTESGVSGQPSFADRETGERLFNAAVEELTSVIEEYRGW